MDLSIYRYIKIDLSVLKTIIFQKNDFNYLVLRQLPLGCPNESEIKQNIKGLSIKIKLRWKIEGSEPNISNLGFLTFGARKPMTRSNNQLQGRIP